MQNDEKMQLLISVAKLYYIENMLQSEIAKLLGVSRPLISKYLQEAKKLGIVKIEINDFLSQDNEDEMMKMICQTFDLDFLHVVPASRNKDINDQVFVDYINNYLLNNYVDNSLIGLGWGSVIGSCIAKLNPQDRPNKLLGEVIPLISNAPISYRNYHTNELVRMLADNTGLKAEYLYAPVICANADEKNVFMNTEQVKTMFQKYKKLDYALIQIRNFPSVPDLATTARFEKKLQEEKAVGMALGYYFDISGQVISSSHDYSIQIPLEDIKNTPTSIAIINARTSVNAALGALRSGLFRGFLMSESVFKELVTMDFMTDMS